MHFLSNMETHSTSPKDITKQEDGGSKINKLQFDPLLSPEQAYLQVLARVLEDHHERETRNGLTLSRFGERMEFDLEQGFPLLTTKRMFWKGILGELLWFLRAETNANKLNAMGIKIWNLNSTREYLDSVGLLDYPEGDCGPIYGFQWRNFMGSYKGCDHDYINHGDGIDQLANIIHQIKTNPSSRRLVMSGWNPMQASQMVLPPCHTLYQFYVQDGKLSCQMYQRSGDMFLGVPFNIASTALLTHIIAKLTDLVPSKVILVLGDAHIYKDHVDAVKEQLSRTCLPLCRLNILRREEVDKPEQFEMGDFSLQSYQSHKRIPAKMIV